MFWDAAIILVPCDLTIDNAGFGCATLQGRNKTNMVEKRKFHKGCTKELNRLDFYYPFIDGKAPLVSMNMHTCNDSTHMLLQYVCDGRKDCVDGGDEVGCHDVCYFEVRADLPQDCFTKCHRSNCTCTHLYYQCECGGCIPIGELCDGHSDCHDASDEVISLCSAVYSMQVLFKIFKPNLIYHNNTFNNPISTCIKAGIPQHLYVNEVCNGVQDCDSGIDETGVNCSRFVVVDSFRCAREKQQLDRNTLFNTIQRGMIICPLLDDHVLHFDTFKLPRFCNGKGLVVHCKFPDYLPELQPIIRVFVIAQMVNKSSIEQFQSHSFVISTSNNSLMYLGVYDSLVIKLLSFQFTKLRQLTKLILYNDSIHDIHHNSFADLLQLHHLCLALNAISYMYTKWFVHLRHLTYLDLSHNQLVDIESIAHIPSLQRLYLYQVKLVFENVSYTSTEIHILTIEQNNQSLKLPFSANEYVYSYILKQNSFTFFTTHEHLCCFADKADICISDVATVKSH